MNIEPNKVSIFFRIDKKLRMQLKMFSAKAGKTMQTVCSESIEFYMKSKGSPVEKE